VSALFFFMMAALLQRQWLRGPSIGAFVLQSLAALPIVVVPGIWGLSRGSVLPSVLAAWLLVALLILDGRWLARESRGRHRST